MKHEEDINGRINKGRMAISKLNILWDRDSLSQLKQKQTFIMQ